jgi:F-type H+-transporting ATPase subunit b
MDNVMNVDPGLVIWTLINFGIFLFILLKLGTKPIIKALNSREDGIKNSIEEAEKANAEAKNLLAESQKKLDKAQQEMAEIIAKGREQAELHIRKAAEEAEKVKRQKVEEAAREMDQSKDKALLELRSEVADMVIIATKKIIGETVDKDKHYKLIQSSIEKLPNN